MMISALQGWYEKWINNLNERQMHLTTEIIIFTLLQSEELLLMRKS
jgi:hypothetical protein